MSDVLSAEDVAEKFWSYVKKRGPDDCWAWTGGSHVLGYGRFHVDGKLVQAHRFAYELLVGPIPDGLHLDHLCRNPGCVNPDHLEPVTRSENSRRGVGYARTRQQTHCMRNHEFTPENTYWTTGGFRQCVTCKNERQREYREQKREARRQLAALGAEVEQLRAERDEGRRKIEAYDAARAVVKREGNTRAEYVLRAEAAEDRVDAVERERDAAHEELVRSGVEMLRAADEINALRAAARAGGCAADALTEMRGMAHQAWKGMIAAPDDSFGYALFAGRYHALHDAINLLIPAEQSAAVSGQTAEKEEA